MLKAPGPRATRFIALGAGLAVIGVASLAARLASGPLEAEWLRKPVAARLAAQVDGGHASVSAARVRWFDEEKSLGLELDGVRLADRSGRPVLSAGRVQAALATDALLGAAAAPGRIVVRDFYLAASVSPGGRYALGWDATGEAGEPSSLDRVLSDLTGRERHGRPLSFLRRLELTGGRVAFRQVGGAARWSGAVKTVRFVKREGRLEGRVDLTVDDGGGDAPARLKLAALGRTGLGDAAIAGSLVGLRPARVFPSVGAARPLSALDAVVSGEGEIRYGLEKGVQAAHLALAAGPGRVRLGGPAQAMSGGGLVADFDRRTGEVALSTLRLDAARTRFDLSGRFRLLPEDASRNRPASLVYALTGPSVTASLASDSAPQTLTDVRLEGRFVPSERRLQLTRIRARLGDASVAGTGELRRDRKGALGLKFSAGLQGAVGREQVFAFWPNDFVRATRSWLAAAVRTSRFHDVRFVMDAPPGSLGKPALRDDALELRFAFSDAEVLFSDLFPAVTEGAGRGVLTGNGFDLALTGGAMGSVRLSEGSVDIPKFHPGGAPAMFKARAQGDARALLETLDGPRLRLVSNAGFAPARVGGRADVRVEIMRPMLANPPFEDYRIRYEGAVSGARVADAALGWDVADAALTVKGSAEALEVKGRGAVGPYRGALTYKADFDGEDAVDLEGTLDASMLGGAPGLTLPFSGRFETEGREGAGVVRSAAFDGRVSWSEAQGRFALDGHGDARALRKVRTPLSENFPDRFPARVRLTRAGAVWRGEVAADALSGALAFTPGDRARASYQAAVTPAEARRLGLEHLPLFRQTRVVTVDAVYGATAGEADVRLDRIAARVGWTRDARGSERRLSATLRGEDLTALGAPDLFRPGRPIPVQAVWRATPRGGEDFALDLAGTPVRAETQVDGSGVASAVIDAEGLARLGLVLPLESRGAAGVTVRWSRAGEGRTVGSVDADLTGMELSWRAGTWRKPQGRPARTVVAFLKSAETGLRLNRITASGQGVSAEGSGVVSADGRRTVLDFTRAELEGFLDSSIRLERDASLASDALTLRGRWLNAEAFLSGSDAGGGGAADGAGAPRAVRLDAAFSAVRLGAKAALRDVKATGVLGRSVRLDATGRTPAGSLMRASLTPQAGGAAAIRVDADDAGEAARALFGLETLKGGKGALTGRLTSEGADLKLVARDVRLVRAPTMAQILTMGSLDGLADTLNGDGVRFSYVEAPLQLRGSRLIVGEARATGSALGFTAQGVADLKADTVAFRGTLAPAYALNSVVGAVPVVGKLLVSREGEGVVGLGWAAEGPMAKPRVTANPLSLMTPGVLRRIFEGAPPARAEAATAAPGG